MGLCFVFVLESVDSTGMI